MDNNIDRRAFLKAGTAAGLGAIAAGAALTAYADEMSHPGPASMIGFKDKPRDLIKIGYVGIGNQGLSHVHNLIKIEGCQVTAVCDINPARTDIASKTIKKYGHPAPAIYTGGDTDFVRMCETEDLDLVYTATPWRWHVPVCMSAMKNGKHAATEVNLATTIDECWQLVEASEKYKKHCIMMENCCYDRIEMMVLNMINQNLFGELLHARGGYMHDLRWHKFDDKYYQGQWRLAHSIKRDGNLYPTHGLGPIAQCFDINRGDAFDYVVSMSSPSIGMNEYAAAKFGPDSPQAKQKYALGDVNTAMIKTKKGRTIILTHDTSTPRPYSRDIVLQGSKGIIRKYPTARIHLEGVSPAHTWQDVVGGEDNTDAVNYLEKYDHPLWKQMEETSKGAGHGGMDFIEDYRLVNALRKGLEPDMDVYDGAAWSAIVQLTEISNANGSKPVKCPDFTRGKWKQHRQLQVDNI